MPASRTTKTGKLPVTWFPRRPPTEPLPPPPPVHFPTPPKNTQPPPPPPPEPPTGFTSPPPVNRVHITTKQKQKMTNHVTLTYSSTFLVASGLSPLKESSKEHEEGSVSPTETAGALPTVDIGNLREELPIMGERNRRRHRRTQVPFFRRNNPYPTRSKLGFRKQIF